MIYVKDLNRMAACVLLDTFKSSPSGAPACSARAFGRIVHII